MMEHYVWDRATGGVRRSAGPPLLFETMCTVSGKWSDLQIRYETVAEALETHRDLVEHLSVGGTPDDFSRE